MPAGPLKEVDKHWDGEGNGGTPVSRPTPALDLKKGVAWKTYQNLQPDASESQEVAESSV